MASLYERLGGVEAIESVVESFVAHCAAPMRGDIVEVESQETGVPLPGSYQPAPALH